MDTDTQVSTAKRDLAERLGIDETKIKVESARAVNWRSGAGGCPERGMSYTMALVPGLQILLSADGDVYHYHAVRDRAPRFCPAERAEAPATGVGEEIM